MQRRIIEWTGTRTATCTKSTNQDPHVFKVGDNFDPEKAPCQHKKLVTLKFGDEEETREVACSGTLVLDPFTKRWGGVTYTFDPKDKILGIPCHGRKVAVVEDLKPDDNGIWFFNELVKSSTNSEWFWAEDLEAILSDQGVIEAIQRNLEKIRVMLGIVVFDEDPPRRGPGRPPKV